MMEMKIEESIIGEGHPTFVVAEVSANHNNNFDDAVRIFRAAKDSGADAIKTQTYTPDTITIKSDKDYFRINGGTQWDGKTLYNLYSEAYMPWDWQPKLKEIAEDLGLVFFSTPFDATAVEFLHELNVPCWKVASFEIVDLPLIEKMAVYGKPIIMSTGMATQNEIKEAVRTARQAGASELALLKCTSAYPAPPEEMNLRTIPHLAESFRLPVGLSDHTLGIAVPVAAVALGACIVEKHLMLSRSIAGPDKAFSLEPSEFKAMVKAIRTAEKALGEIQYKTGRLESGSLVFRRSLFFVEDIKAGEEVTEKHVRSIRPGYGLPPKYLKDVLRRKALMDIERGTPVSWSLLGDKK